MNMNNILHIMNHCLNLLMVWSALFRVIAELVREGFKGPTNMLHRGLQSLHVRKSHETKSFPWIKAICDHIRGMCYAIIAPDSTQLQKNCKSPSFFCQSESSEHFPNWLSWVESGALNRAFTGITTTRIRFCANSFSDNVMNWNMVQHFINI